MNNKKNLTYYDISGKILYVFVDNIKEVKEIENRPAGKNCNYCGIPS